jgi:hypothetical protein
MQLGYLRITFTWPFLPPQHQEYAQGLFIQFLTWAWWFIDLPLQGKHGSDSEAYTQVGEFDVTRFNYTFDIYSSEPHTHLTFTEGVRMVHGNRNAYDPVRLLPLVLGLYVAHLTRLVWVECRCVWVAFYLYYALARRWPYEEGRCSGSLQCMSRHGFFLRSQANTLTGLNLLHALWEENAFVNVIVIKYVEKT